MLNRVTSTLILYPCLINFYNHVFFPSNPLLLQPLKAHVVKLVDTSDLGSDAARCGGSSPSMGTAKGHWSIRK